MKSPSWPEKAAKPTLGSSRGTPAPGKSLTPGEAEERGRRKFRYWHWWWCGSYNTDNIPVGKQNTKQLNGREGRREVEQKIKGPQTPPPFQGSDIRQDPLFQKQHFFS